MLHGRTAELAEIDLLLEHARSGHSGALVVRGDPGIGKSALLTHAVDGAGDMHVLHVQAIESECVLPFGCVQLLFQPVTNRLDYLPAGQAGVLRRAFGLEAVPHDRFHVGAAVLTLLSDVGEDAPVLCVVDDAQWLDTESADALLFAARRLDAEGVAMIFALRGDAALPGEHGLREVTLCGLSDPAAQALLADSAADLAPQAKERVLHESAGNPLALLELPKAFTPEQRSGRLSPLPFAVETNSPPTRVQRSLQARIAGLSEPTRTVALVAAADNTGDPGIILAALEYLGYTVGDVEPMERLGLIQLTPTALRFLHPLARAAAYQVAPRTQRVAAHQALATVMDGETYADRRIWHLAAAATGPDERIAADLDGVATRAYARQGEAVASVAFERAAELSADDDHAAGRLVRAASHAVRAGQLPRAVELTERAEPLVNRSRPQADLDHVRVQVESERGAPHRAGRMLVAAARRLAGSEPGAATRMLLEAGRNASFVSDAELASDVADALRPVGEEVLADGMDAASRLLGDEAVADLSDIRRALVRLQEAAHDQRDRVLLAIPLSLMVGDELTATRLGEALVAQCRQHGVIGVLPQALGLLAQARMLRSDLRAASTAAAEARNLARDIGQPHRSGYLTAVMAWLAAIEGEEEQCTRLVREAERVDRPSGVMGAWAAGMLHLGLQRPQLALDHLAPIWHDGPRHHTVALYAAPEVIEAAVRADRRELAAEPMRRLEIWADAIGRPWSAAVVARSKALLVEGDDAEEQFVRAIDIYADEVAPDQPFQHARAALLYGGWLRRRQRRVEARVHLGAAVSRFDAVGARPWADRARVELDAAGGESAPESAGRTGLLGGLSPQEWQVVRLAARGMSNREIGAELFLSPRTIGNHLYRAFPKLAVGSRDELSELDLAELG